MQNERRERTDELTNENCLRIFIEKKRDVKSKKVLFLAIFFYFDYYFYFIFFFSRSIIIINVGIDFSFKNSFDYLSIYLDFSLSFWFSLLQIFFPDPMAYEREMDGISFEYQSSSPDVRVFDQRYFNRRLASN